MTITIFVIMKNKINNKLSVLQYAEYTGQSRQNVLYHIQKGGTLDHVTDYEQVGRAYVLTVNTTSLQKFIKNNSK